MSPRGSDHCLANRDTDLVKARNHVAGGKETGNAGFHRRVGDELAALIARRFQRA